MNKNLLLKMKGYLNNQKDKSRRNKLFVGLALIVFVVTIYVLMVPGITMEEVLICFDEEHVHTSECYGTDSDMEDIIYLTNIIEELPTVEEMNNNINELATEEEKKEYKDETIATATIAYSYYLDLDEKVKSKISNIDKLLEYYNQGLIEVVEDTSNNNVDGFNNTGASTFILKNNSLEPIEVADTSKFVQINLYDYFIKDEDGKNINDKFNSVSNKYPAFFQSYGPDTGKITTDTIKNWRFNFGDMITVDRIGAIKDNDYQDKVANTINQNMPSSGQALSGYIKNVLGDDKYPAIADGNLSLRYLFDPSEGYAKKQNINGNISKLFQYDEVTGKYYFDSRSNFAQFDQSTSTFKIYNQRITPNFMQYPFGNFLPLNNINEQTTLASTINKQYFDDVVASAREKGSDKDTYGDMTTYYNRVADRMSEWTSVMTARNNNKSDWDAAFVANQYFELSDLQPNIKNEMLTDLYNIDFDEPTNFFFGMDIEMNFIQPKDGITGVTEKNPMIFEFSGDDDVWVYIDGILFLDLSGRHRHVSGKINFQEGIVTYHALDTATGDTSDTPYKTVKFSEILANVSGEKPELNENGTFKNYSPHNFKFYYMERGAGSSVMKMNFNFPLVEKNSLMVTKELDENSVDLAGNPDFSFQILKVIDGVKSNETFVDVGTIFDILDENGTKVDTGEILENGIFKLKAGQTAVFKEISADKGSYYVREILDPNWVAQYEAVTVDGEATTTNESVLVGTEDFVGYESSIKDISDGHTSFVYTNKVDPYEFGTLKITKEIEGITNINDVFKFKVTIDDEVLPLGYKYTITDKDGNVITEDKPIEKDCETCDYGYVLISAGETATLKNVLVGSRYQVEEIISNINGFNVRYENEEGTITVNQEIVGITVTNISTGTNLVIPVKKTIANSDGESYDYSFKITEMEGTSIDSLVEKTDGVKQEITISDVVDTKMSVSDDSFRLEYARPNYDVVETYHYYKIEEVLGTDSGSDTRYDDSVYIIKVTVTNTEDSFVAKVTGVYKDNVDITSRDDNGDITNIIEFINKLLVDLTISKEVQGNIETSGEFDFEITITENGLPMTETYNYQKVSITEEVITFQDMGITPFGVEQQKDATNILEEGTLTFDTSGKANIELSHNEVVTIYGIPYGVEYNVTELTTNGYVVMHNINSGENIEGEIATGNLDRDDTIIKFINMGGYLLPATGGSGTLIFGIIGLLLLIVPVIYIGYSFYRRKRNVV